MKPTDINASPVRHPPNEDPVTLRMAASDFDALLRALILGVMKTKLKTKAGFFDRARAQNIYDNFVAAAQHDDGLVHLCIAHSDFTVLLLTLHRGLMKTRPGGGEEWRIVSRTYDNIVDAYHGIPPRTGSNRREKHVNAPRA